MGVKKSEYGRAYVKSPTKYISKEFEGKLDYRALRRQMEQRHTPFDWENGLLNGVDDELDTVRSSLFDDRLNPHPPQEPEHIKKFKLFKQMREGQKQEKGSGDSVIPCKTPPNSLEVEDPEILTMPPLHPEQTESEIDSDVIVDSARLYKNVDEDKKARKNQNNNAAKKGKKKSKNVKCTEKNISRPVRPSKYREIPKPRPVSAPTGRPSRRVPPPPIETEERPPFVPYGGADKERSTGALKTYNIRASADIYPSALKAQRRKEADIKRRSERVKSAPLREKRKEALFNDIMNRATASWDTEYRRNYAGFEASEYAKNVADRVSGGERFYVAL